MAEDLHFGRAAARLHVAQPAVSQTVRRLEEELGLQLLHRTSRVVRLTEPGRVFAEGARKALAGVDTAVEATLRAGGNRASLRVACAPHISMDRLQYFLAALQERDPGLRTNVTHASPEAQVEWLNNMELDVGIFRSEGHHGIETEALFAGEPLMAYLHTGHPLAAKPVLGTDDLTQERLIGLPLESASEQCVGLRKQLRDLGYRFAAVYEPPGLDPRDLMLAVADGHGILLATRAMADTTRANGIVVRRPLDPTIPLPDIVVAWRADPPAHLAPILATIRHVARRIREAPRD